MRGMTLFALTAFAAMASSPAAAQVRMTQQGSGRPISFAFGGGASVPVGSYKDALKAGWNGQGSVIFHFAGLPLSLRADLNYNQLHVQEGSPVLLWRNGWNRYRAGRHHATDPGRARECLDPVPHGPGLSLYHRRPRRVQHQDQPGRRRSGGAGRERYEVRRERRRWPVDEALRRIRLRRGEAEQHLHGREGHRRARSSSRSSSFRSRSGSCSSDSAARPRVKRTPGMEMLHAGRLPNEPALSRTTAPVRGSRAHVPDRRAMRSAAAGS